MRPLLGLVPVVAVVAAFSALVMGVVVALVAVTDHPFGYFSRDPASTLGGSPLVGVLSFVGVLIVWGAAVASTIAGAYVARARGWRHASVLFAAAAGTAYLALDDLFMFHEEIFPKNLGIEQEAVLVAYVVVALAFLWWFRGVIREHEWPLLALAFVVLGTSLALDQFGDALLGGEPKRFFEEGFKLYGYALLATYLVRLGARMHADAYPRPGPDWVNRSRARESSRMRVAEESVET